jgi:spore germination protein
MKMASLSLMLIFLLTGCELLPTYIVTELNIIQGYGYDLSEKNELKGIYLYPVYKSDKEPPSIVTITGNGPTSKQARADANRKTRHPLVSGQIRLLLLSKSLAEKGIYPVLDTLNRDPSIGTLIQVAIVDGATKDVLTMKSKEKENMALYIREMLIQNMDRGKIPETDFYTFMYQHYQKGQDPYLPILKKEKEEIEISSIAIFKDDKLNIDISNKYLFIFKSLVDEYSQGVQSFTLKNGENVVFDNIQSNTKYQVKIENGEPVFTINLKIVARIQEYSSSEKKPLPELTDNISKEIENQLEADGLSIMNKFKENDVDPLGLGSKYEAHYRDYDEKTWKDLYPSTIIKLNANVKIIHSGIMD